MPDLFRGLFDTEMTQVISVQNFLICLGSALAIVCVVIMMVNGNVGAGVAVAGAFSLVRFRSVPGSAREIGAIFLAMGAGLVVGMGYIGYAFLIALVLGAVSAVYNQLDFGSSKRAALDKTLHITIPEDLDYTGVFDDLLREYAARWELTQVKTTNMGSMFRLTYNITPSAPGREKEFIDKLRCRNGNLEISLCRQETALGEL